MSDDYRRRSIRESLIRLGRNPERVTSVSDTVEAEVHESLRKVSQSRISQILRQLRAAHGFSYAQIQTDTGLSQQLLFDVEYGDRRLNLDELTQLAECYGISINDILGIDIL